VNKHDQSNALMPAASMVVRPVDNRVSKYLWKAQL